MRDQMEIGDEVQTMVERSVPREHTIKRCGRCGKFHAADRPCEEGRHAGASENPEAAD